MKGKEKEDVVHPNEVNLAQSAVLQGRSPLVMTRKRGQTDGERQDARVAEVSWWPTRSVGSCYQRKGHSGGKRRRIPVECSIEVTIEYAGHRSVERERGIEE